MLVRLVSAVDVLSEAAFIVHALINGGIVGVTTFVLLRARRVE